MKTAKKTLIKYITVACQTGILLGFPVVEVTETEEDIGTKFPYLLTKVKAHLNPKAIQSNTSHVAANSTGVTIVRTLIALVITRMGVKRTTTYQ